MGHGHDHGAGSRHDDPVARRRRMRALGATLALTGVFTVVELVGGLLTGSLALLADAGHMLSDDLALGLALGAIWLAGRPATDRRSFGFRRAEILAALANGVALVAISIWIFIEAAGRLADPPDVAGAPVLAVGATGLAVNVAAAGILWRARSGSLNVRAALAHVLADLVGSVGVIAAAVVILTTGWRQADPLIGIAIGLLILIGSYGILRDAVNVLLETTPRDIDATALRERLQGFPEVVALRDLHVWEITGDFPALSAHITVADEADCHAARRAIETVLRREFGVSHTTLQVDHVGDDGPGGCADAGRDYAPEQVVPERSSVGSGDAGK